MTSILVLHGPNLNLLGQRETRHYGAVTLMEIEQRLEQLAQTDGHELFHYQSNAEHELVNQIHLATQQQIEFILFNPAAFTHSSIALRDALLAVNIPFIEIHLSNIHGRESFRHHSYLADVAIGVISGFGAYSYELAYHAAINYLQE